MKKYTTKPDQHDVLIYVLIDPRDMKIRYVGKTIQPLKRRLYNHIATANFRKKTYPVVSWIRGLINQDMKPSICLLEVCDVDNWAARERYWIQYGRDHNWDLVNATSGGETTSGVIVSDETRKKQSLINRGENNTRAKLKKHDVLEMRDAYDAGGITTYELAEKYGISPSSAQMIVRGLTWKHVGGATTEPNLMPAAILDATKAVEIREMFANGLNIINIAEEFGIAISTAYQVVNGRLWPNAGGKIKQPTSNIVGENNPRAKLTQDDVKSIRQTYSTGVMSYSQLASIYGVTKALIGMIIRGEIWRSAE